MKSTLLILSLFLSVILYSQSTSHNYTDHGLTVSVGLYSDNFYSSELRDNTPESTSILEGERLNIFTAGSVVKPLPPVLTTGSPELEICTGNSTRLTASSSATIRWYTTPPPIGTPVGTGTSYITPVLSTGYYTYYAIAEEGGISSDISAMEVVMVYPTPTLSVLSSARVLCAGESATLTVRGTSFYKWENGQTSASIVIHPGTTSGYKVTGINTAGCKSEIVFTQAVEACTFSEAMATGIAEQAADKLYKVFPNPNNGEFNVSVNSISENTKVDVFNSLGQLVYSSKLTTEVTPVALKDYPNGIYILRIAENDRVLKQEKIIKQ